MKPGRKQFLTRSMLAVQKGWSWRQIQNYVFLVSTQVRTTIKHSTYTMHRSSWYTFWFPFLLMWHVILEIRPAHFMIWHLVALSGWLDVFSEMQVNNGARIDLDLNLFKCIANASFINAKNCRETLFIELNRVGLPISPRFLLYLYSLTISMLPITEKRRWTKLPLSTLPSSTSLWLHRLFLLQILRTVILESLLR